jgi:myo-inositol-1(or 4)-monophosphatase
MSSVELSDADLQSILEFTSTLARKAGDLMLEGSEAIAASGDVNEKKNSVDLVTEYDVRVEELVRDEIKKAYPKFQLCVNATAYCATMADAAVASGRSLTLRVLDRT